MRYTLLSTLAGFWLFVTPFLWPSQGVRAVLAAGAGALVMVLAIMAMAFTRLGYAVAAVGAALALANLVLPGGVGMTANFAVTALCLMVGGLAPIPKAVVLAPLAARAPMRAPQAAAREVSAGEASPHAA